MKVHKFIDDKETSFGAKAHPDGKHLCGDTTIKTGDGFVCCEFHWKKITCEECLKKRRGKNV